MLGLKEEGERAANVETYQSESAAQGMESGAIEEVRQGYAAQRAGNIAAAGTLLQGAGQAMYMKYKG